MGSDESQTYFLEAYEFPLSEADHTTIAEMLCEQAVFGPSFALETNEDLYDALFYRRQAYHHDTSITILADRNVVTRWFAVLAGRPGSYRYFRHRVKLTGDRSRKFC